MKKRTKCITCRNAILKTAVNNPYLCRPCENVLRINGIKDIPYYLDN